MPSGSRFRRAAVRVASNSTGYFTSAQAPAPPFPIPFSPQEATFVVLAQYIDVTSVRREIFSQFDPLGASPNLGYFFGGGDAEGIHLGVGNGVTFPVAYTDRVLTAADEGLVHRLVGTISVSDQELWCYLNGVKGTGFGAAIASSVGNPDVVPHVMGAYAGSLATTAWAAIDLAYLPYALTPTDVLDLDREILACGGIPSDYAPWDLLMRAESLLAMSPTSGAGTLWSCGGRADGKVVASVGAAPVLSSVYVADKWGHG